MPETQKLRHTASDKVHVAGELNDKVQRCSRCGAKIAYNSELKWEAGASVLSRRGGMMVLTDAEAAEFRACGRKAVEVSK